MSYFRAQAVFLIFGITGFITWFALDIPIQEFNLTHWSVPIGQAWLAGASGFWTVVWMFWNKIKTL